MVEFVDCPLVGQKISLDEICRKCPYGHHDGVVLAVQVETIDPETGAMKSSETEAVRDIDYLVFSQLHIADQLTTMARWVRCTFPRRVMIETVR